MLVLVDLIAVLAAWASVLVVVEPASVAMHDRIVTVVGTSTVALAAVAWQRLYLARTCAIRAVELVRLARATIAATAVALVAPRFVPVDIGREEAVYGGAAMFVLLSLGRGLYRTWLRSRRRAGEFVRPVVVVGTNVEGLRLTRILNDHPEIGFEAVGVVGDGHEASRLPFSVPYLGAVDDALEIVEHAGANGVLIAASALEPEELNVAVRRFLRNGVHVHLSNGLQGIAHRRLQANPVAYEPLFYVEPLQLAPWQQRAKRVIDLVVTIAVGVPLALPLLALAAVAIKLDDGGPVLFKQTRVGRYGRRFTVYKLRTMVPEAESLLIDVRALNERGGGPLFKHANDPRRTRVGRVLERFSLDELPQLWNVLRGEMSLVGPRPALPHEVAQFDEELLQRTQVPPGVTGLWQVEARDNPSFAAYRRFDLFYVENWSVGLDLAILAATVQNVLGRGISGLFGGDRREARRRPVVLVLD